METNICFRVKQYTDPNSGRKAVELKKKQAISLEDMGKHYPRRERERERPKCSSKTLKGHPRKSYTRFRDNLQAAKRQYLSGLLLSPFEL